MDKLKSSSIEQLQRIKGAIKILLDNSIPADNGVMQEIEQELLLRKAEPQYLKLARFIFKHKRIEHRKLLQNCSRFSAFDIREMVKSLEECGQIKVEVEGARNKKVYIWIGEDLKEEDKKEDIPAWLKR